MTTISLPPKVWTVVAAATSAIYADHRNSGQAPYRITVAGSTPTSTSVGEVFASGQEGDFAMGAGFAYARPLNNEAAEITITTRSLGLFGPVSPENFGAVGDGVTDDTAALQAAIDYASENDTAVELSAATYLVTAATGAPCLRIPTDGSLTLKGAGRHVSIIKTTSAAPILGGLDNENVEITNIGFQGNATARIGFQRGVVLRGVNRALISECWFTALGEGCINLARQGFGGSDTLGDGTRQPEMVQITDNLMTDNWGTIAIVTKFTGGKAITVANNVIRNSCTGGISIESEQGGAGTEFAQNVTITGNTIEGCSYLFASGFSNIAGAIGCTEQARRITITGNVVDNVRGNTVAWGITLSSSPAQDDTVVESVTISGNVVSTVTADTGRGHAVDIGCGDAIIQNFAITGNVVNDCTVGVHLAPGFNSGTGEIRGLAISGNVIFDCAEIGIWYDPSGGGSAVALRKPAITGNVVRGCGSHGMSLKMNGGVILGNSCIQNTGVGIVVATGSSSVVVASNYCESNGGDGIQGNGVSTQYVGNTCLNNGQVAATSYGIRHVSGGFAQIVHNICSDTQGSPTQDFGIRGVGGETVRDNELIGNAAAAVWGGIAAYNTGTYDAGGNRTA